jgi:uncharacterized protein GlcG (DUF336 family)
MSRSKFLRKFAKVVVPAACTISLAATAWAQGASSNCSSLPGYDDLKSALIKAVADEKSGLDFQMWATLVDRNGIVCAVAFSGADSGAQWPGSRVISAQKANTANSFSLNGPTGSTVFNNGLALSTANLFSAVQPGGSLFGLQESNPVNTQAAYKGPSSNFGQASDPMVGEKIGGINVFGGGLALYALNGKAETVVGGLGVSGDTSCADHMIGWRVRNYLQLDHMANIPGVSGDATRPDNIIYDITDNPNGGTGKSTGGFGHPMCINTGDQTKLPVVQP